jgi:hypothetical protein
VVQVSGATDGHTTVIPTVLCNTNCCATQTLATFSSCPVVFRLPATQTLATFSTCFFATFSSCPVVFRLPAKLSDTTYAT